MNIYLDLEATQFSREIISLGAVNEKKESFFSLVKPKNTKKITSLITKITGLTPDDFDDKDIPNISKVITEFWEWCIKDEVYTESVKIFVFGNFDITLLKAEFNRYINNNSFKEILKGTQNLCPVINKLVYGLNESHGLLQIYIKLVGLEKEQTHDPVDDADMLRIIHNYLKETPLDVLKCIEENYYINKYIKRYKKNKISNNKLKEYFNSLCDLELENIEYKDIGNIIGFSHVENRIKMDYLELTGNKLKGNVYD